MDAHLDKMMDQERMLNTSSIRRTTWATAPVCRIRFQTPTSMKNALAKEIFIIAKPTASMSYLLDRTTAP